MSFHISEYVNLRVVVMFLGILLFGLGFVMGWHEIRTVVKILLVFGAITFAVGLKYNSIYNVGVKAEQRVAGAFGQKHP